MDRTRPRHECTRRGDEVRVWKSHVLNSRSCPWLRPRTDSASAAQHSATIDSFLIQYLSDYFAVGRDAKYCGRRVCLSVSISRKPEEKMSRNFLYMLSVTVTQSSSDDNVMLCTSGFVDAVTFAHNVAIRPKNYTCVLAYICRFRPIFLSSTFCANVGNR